MKKAVIKERLAFAEEVGHCMASMRVCEIDGTKGKHDLAKCCQLLGLGMLSAVSVVNGMPLGDGDPDKAVRRLADALYESLEVPEHGDE